MYLLKESHSIQNRQFSSTQSNLAFWWLHARKYVLLDIPSGLDWRRTHKIVPYPSTWLYVAMLAYASSFTVRHPIMRHLGMNLHTFTSQTAVESPHPVHPRYLLFQTIADTWTGVRHSAVILERGR